MARTLGCPARRRAYLIALVLIWTNFSFAYLVL